MKITDLKCAIIGNNPVIRITTDKGIDGYGQAEASKDYLKPHIMFYRQYLLDQDPTDVERVMKRIRRLGAFKPWGSSVSAIEFALWDIAGKAAGVPVYKLLGGKVRDRVQVYNGNVRFHLEGFEPEHYADNMRKMKALPENFSIIKQGVSFHGSMATSVPDFYHGDANRTSQHPNSGLLTEKGFNHLMACIEAMKEVCGEEVGLALDAGPGMTPQDLLRVAKACEPLNLMWIEDAITGDYTPYVSADVYRDITGQTSTPIHTGEQIYLRQNFKELIEKRAVDVIGPDPCDIGGIAELKWVTEYADLHGVLMAPHGTLDGLIGLAALLQVSATLPYNYIAFEYPTGNPDWWYDIIDGLPDPIVKDSHIDVWDTPGLGVTFNEKAREHLKEEDKRFFD